MDEMAKDEARQLTEDEIEDAISRLDDSVSPEAKKIIAERLRTGELKLDKDYEIKVLAGYQMEDVDFWNGVTIGDRKLSEYSPEQARRIKAEMLNVLNARILTSDELAKIHFNSQVYNDIELPNGVKTTTRGGHSEGVALVAKILAEELRKRMPEEEMKTLDGEKIPSEGEIAGLFSNALGYMHDFGHTPFGHEGEGALNDEMARFSDEDMINRYRESRRQLLGEEYTVLAGDATAGEMCYEHNEMSAIIAEQVIQRYLPDTSDVLSKRGIIPEGQQISFSPKSLQYIKTGILAHSTSRVKPTPKGIEQQAVRLADKVAYIPQDLLDLIKEGIINISDLNNDQRELLDLKIETTDKQLEEAKTSKRNQKKLEIIDKLSRLNELEPEEQQKFFIELDRRVGVAQRKIAIKCVDPKEPKYADMKEVVDAIDRTYKEHPKLDKEDKSYIDTEPVAVYRELRIAQSALKNAKNSQEYAERLETVKEKSADFSKMLQAIYGMEPLIATLWSTKTTFQDSFIRGELGRVTKKGKETIISINKKNEHTWQMKAVFQYFYTHPEMIPLDFDEKYPESKLTGPQRVSAFIASFTNDGLTNIFNELNKSGQVVSREQAIRAIEEVDPNFDIDTFTEDTTILSGGRKVSANDKLEIMYTKLTGKHIIENGSVEMPEFDARISSSVLELSRRTRYRNDKNEVLKDVPEELLETKLDVVTSAPKHTSERAAEILKNVITITRGAISSEDIKQVVAQQRSKEIDKHKKEAEEKAEEFETQL